MNESYMIIVVCVIINIKIFSLESIGLSVMSILCALFLFFSVFLPIIFVWQLKKNLVKLKLIETQRKYGALDEELDTSRGKKMLFVPGFFLMRRMLLAIAICAVNGTLIWQIMLMVSQVIVQVIIIGESVYSSKTKTKMEYFNEIILMQTLYTIVCFSPFI
mgnify:FL=1